MRPKHQGAFSILPARREGTDLFTTDERLKLLSFTGSPFVGWNLKARVGKKVIWSLAGCYQTNVAGKLA